jgi:hypothetical protein
LYTKEQSSQLRQAFWTAYGQYIAPVLSADGLKINWINYKTGVKHVYFKMEADNKRASISIQIAHPDTELQELFFEQFKELKRMLNGYLNEEWHWLLHVFDDNGKIISKISRELAGVSIYNESDWPALISFFKPRIIALDEFWSVAKYNFET